MSKYSDLGIRMKIYESQTSALLLPRLPILARIDGKTFHTFCRGLQRPYDTRLSELMQQTTKFLVEETHALCGYTQSDEISLVWYTKEVGSEALFGGKVLKLTSILASMATAAFNARRREMLPDKPEAFFDCRVWNVPTEDEIANYFIWREQDAVRNSIAMAAQAQFSHKQLHGKNAKDMHEMLHEKGIHWGDYPDFFKRGSYWIPKMILRPFSAEELTTLPEKHEARKNPDLMVQRRQVQSPAIPILTTIQNRVGVLLYGEDPILLDDQQEI